MLTISNKLTYEIALILVDFLILAIALTKALAAF